MDMGSHGLEQKSLCLPRYNVFLTSHDQEPKSEAELRPDMACMVNSTAGPCPEGDGLLSLIMSSPLHSNSPHETRSYLIILQAHSLSSVCIPLGSAMPIWGNIIQ